VHFFYKDDVDCSYSDLLSHTSHAMTVDKDILGGAKNASTVLETGSMKH
jgi:hypothetical protein